MAGERFEGMKKLLVLAYEYYPTENSNTKMIRKACGLLAEQYDITLVTVKTPEAAGGLTPAATQAEASGRAAGAADASGAGVAEKFRVIRVPGYSFHREKCTGPLTPGILGRMAAAKIEGKLKRDETVLMLSRLFEHEIRKAVRAADYDAAVSFSNPFLTHCCASRLLRGSGVPWVAVCFDPFFSNRIYDPALREKRKQLEEQVMASAAKVMVMVPTDRDYLRNGVAFADRIVGFEVPGILPMEEFGAGTSNGKAFGTSASDGADLGSAGADGKSSGAAASDGAALGASASDGAASGPVQCRFFGSLYREIRNPSAAVRLFSALGGDAEMRFIGRIVDGTEAEFFPAGCGCAHVDELSGEALAAEYAAAEVLVNLGNTVDNQMPSKIFEYISTGKPILNIHPSPACPTLTYIEKYPLGLNVAEAEILADVAGCAGKVRAFCRETRGKRVSAETVLRLYAENTYEAFAAKLDGVVKSILPAAGR